MKTYPILPELVCVVLISAFVMLLAAWLGGCAVRGPDPITHAFAEDVEPLPVPEQVQLAWQQSYSFLYAPHSNWRCSAVLLHGGHEALSAAHCLWGREGQALEVNDGKVTSFAYSHHKADLVTLQVDSWSERAGVTLAPELPAHGDLVWFAGEGGGDHGKLVLARWNTVSPGGQAMLQPMEPAMPGDSGGPVYNVFGELAAIVVTRSVDDPLAFVGAVRADYR